MRQGGYRSLCDYAVIGDGRTAALVALDGSIDWLCLPNFDSPSIFGAILDPVRGGAFHLQPSVPFSPSRRYLPGSNVLETTFSTERGCVRVVDAITIPDADLAPLRELARVVEGVEGSVPMEWSASPRFAYGASSGKTGWRGDVPVATCGGDAVALMSWGTGPPSWTNGAVGSSWTVEEGQRSILALVAAYGEPMIFPSRSAVESRLAATEKFWITWSSARTYNGPWRDAVVRSALALKLMIFAPSGASVAAPTTSLPEEIGGIRNWDYRFCWIRDSAFLIDALLQL